MTLEAILQGCLSPDNAARKAAEAALAQARQGSAPDSLPLSLLAVARAGAAPELRQMAAVMLRKVVLFEEPGCATDDGSGQHWHRMSEAATRAVADGLLQQVQQEGSDAVRRPLTHTLAEVAALVMGDATGDSWPELWSTMLSCANGPAPAAQESALTLFEHLAPYAVYGLKQHAAVFGAVFKARLADARAPVRVRVAAAKAAAAQIISSDTPEAAAAYADTLPHVLEALGACCAAAAAGGDDDDEAAEGAREMAGALAEVASAHATAFRKVLPQALGLLCRVAGDARCDAQARRLAAEAAISIAEGAPGMARKLPGNGYLAALLPVGGSMLLEHGADEPADGAWEADGSSDPWGLGDSAEADDCNVPLGEELLERVGATIGSKRFLPAAGALVRGLLAGGDWKHRYGGLVALGATAGHVDGDAPGAEALLRGVAAQIAPLAEADPSPRVRWAAQTVLAAFCVHQAPAFQHAAHALVAPAIVRGLHDPSVRVRCAAARCVQAYADEIDGNVDAETLAPYLGATMAGLFGLLALPPQPPSPSGGGGGAGGGVAERDRGARETAVTSISALALSARGLITPFYGSVMPGLQGLLSAPDHAAPAAGARNDDAAAAGRHGRLMKGKALECLSILGHAVGRDVFRADALAAMGGIAGMVAQLEQQRAASASAAASSSGDDDPVAVYMWAAVGRIASALDAADFAPFLPALMPALLASVCSEARTSVVSVSPRSSTLSSGDDDGDDDDDDESGRGFIELEPGEGGQVVRVRTAELEDKLACAGTLSTLLGELKGARMAPYVPGVVDGMLRLLRVSGQAFSDLRATAASTLADALASAAATLPLADARAGAAALAAGHAPASPGVAAYAALLAACLDELQNVLKDDREDDAECLKAVLASVAEVALEGCKAANFAGGGSGGGGGDDDDGAAAGHVRLLGADTMRAVTLALLRAQQAALQRRAVRAAELTVNAEDVDDEAREEAARQERHDSEILFCCVDALGALARSQGAGFLPVYSAHVAGKVRDMAHPACAPVDRQHAVFLIDDVLEHMGDAAVAPDGSHYADEYLPLLIRYTTDPHDALRQAAAFGLGAAAGALSAGRFAPHLAGALVALSTIVERPPTGSRGDPEDNAVTAIGKLLVHQYSPAPPGAPAPRRELMAGFLRHLPLCHDDDEAGVAAQMLCAWVEAGDADVLGGGGEAGAAAAGGGGSAPEPNRLAHVLRVLADALSRPRVARSGGALALRVGALLGRLQAQTAPATLGAVWGALSAPHQQALTAAGTAAAAAAAARR